MKPLRKMKQALHYFHYDKKITGSNPDLWGDSTGLYGNCTDLEGNCTNVQGDLDEIKLEDRPCNIADYVEED